MITIIHGDDLVSSRNYLSELKKKHKKSLFFEEDIVNKESLFSSLENLTLFEEDTPDAVFIENLLVKNKTTSKEFKDLVSYLVSKEKNIDIYLWEPSLLSKTSLNVFKSATVKLFKLKNTLFYFLDSIKPNNPQNIVLFHQALETPDSLTSRPKTTFFGLKTLIYPRAIFEAISSLKSVG